MKQTAHKLMTGYGLRGKLVRRIGGAAFALLLAVAMVYYLKAAAMVEAQAEATARAQAQAAAARVQGELMRFSKVPFQVGQLVTSIPDLSFDQLDRYIKQSLTNTPADELYDLYFFYDDRGYRDPRSNATYTRASLPHRTPLNYDFHDPQQSWYALPKQTRQLSVTEPYFDAGSTEVPMVSVSLPVERDGRFIGVTGSDFKLDSLSQSIAKLHFAAQDAGDKTESFAFLFSKAGNLVTFPDQAQLVSKDGPGKTVQTADGGRYAALAEAKPGDVVHLKLQNDKPALAFVEQIPLAGWTLAMVVPESEILAPLAKFQAFGYLTLGVALVILVALLLMLANQIAQPLSLLSKAAEHMARGDTKVEGLLPKATEGEMAHLRNAFQAMVAHQQAMAEAAEAIASGDLSRTVTPKGATDTLGQAFARMTANLRDVVSRVRTASDVVSQGAEQIGSSSGELMQTVHVQASSAEETSAAMEEMAANLQSVDSSAQDLSRKAEVIRQQSDELAAAVTQTSSAIAELAASIQQVAGNVDDANRVSEEAAGAARYGEEAVVKAAEGMTAISQTMDGIRTTIQVLDQRSAEIGAIIEVIDDIAEQTNLLALNAAIEAARAGEAGRGFAVVADEVRKLAERSAKATREIGTLIKGIQAETSQAVHVTQEGTRKVEQGVQLASHTGEALGRIKTAALKVKDLLGQVASATGEQTRASGQIVTATEQMAAINRQVTGAVEEMNQLTRSVSYATGEQRQGSEQVVLAVESLSRSAQEAANATNQVSGAAEDLREQAHALQETVAFFQVEEAQPELGAVPQARLLASAKR
ncbi:HAMP domain-containing protein [bacterium]|nr:HAMP domain-containing protein [bacterium]